MMNDEVLHHIAWKRGGLAKGEFQETSRLLATILTQKNKKTPTDLHWLGSVLIKLLPLHTDRGESRLESLGQLRLYPPFPL